MDPSTSAEPLEFSDLQGQTLTKQPGELNGCGLPRAPLPPVDDQSVPSCCWLRQWGS